MPPQRYWAGSIMTFRDEEDYREFKEINSWHLKPLQFWAHVNHLVYEESDDDTIQDHVWFEDNEGRQYLHLNEWQLEELKNGR